MRVIAPTPRRRLLGHSDARRQRLLYGATRRLLLASDVADVAGTMWNTAVDLVRHADGATLLLLPTGAGTLRPVGGWSDELELTLDLLPAGDLRGLREGMTITAPPLEDAAWSGLPPDDGDHLLVPLHRRGVLHGALLVPAEGVALDALESLEVLAGCAADALVRVGEPVPVAPGRDPATGARLRGDLLAQADEVMRQPGVFARAMIVVGVPETRAVAETLGYEEADRLLAAVCHRLTQLTDHPEHLARVGDEDFAMFVQGSDAGALHARRAEEIIDAFEDPIQVGDTSMRVAVDIGLAVAESGDEAEDLLRNADAALDKGRRDGTRFGVYDPSIREWGARRLRYRSDLAHAATDGSLRLDYQPIVSIESDTVLGAEALLRWEHPTDGTVSPGVFVPIAEQTGLIVEIGEWVLHEACREAATWEASRDGIAPTIAVNVSELQLRAGILSSHVRSALATSGLSPERLVLELTESQLLEDNQLVLQTLAGLRALGVKIAIDDFGTGYCSLAYLQRFPVDVLKVDRAFVANLVDGAPTALVRGILDLARALQVRTVAEGIETPQQAQRLRALGCHSAQGFYYARPAAADQVRRLLAEGVARPTPPAPSAPVRAPMDAADSRAVTRG